MSTLARSREKELAQSRDPKSRVTAALAHIESAQVELELASSVLSSLCHMSDQQDKVIVLHDRVHALWYKVKEAGERRADKIALDSMSLAACDARDARVSK